MAQFCLTKRIVIDQVDFVLCWTKDGGATGGTGLGIRLAEKLGIKVVNLFNDDTREQLRELIKTRGLLA